MGRLRAGGGQTGTERTTLSMPSATCHFALETRPSADPRRRFRPTVSKANELPFLRSDNTVSLFIKPCECTTYVNPPLQKRPSQRKRYFQTNLTLGGIGKTGKILQTPTPELGTARSSVTSGGPAYSPSGNSITMPHPPAETPPGLSSAISGRLTCRRPAACLLHVAHRRYNPDRGECFPPEEDADPDAEQAKYA